MLETGKKQDVPQIKRGALAAKPESTTLGLQLSFSAETRARPVENDGRATGNPEVIGFSVSCFPTNRNVAHHRHRAGVVHTCNWATQA